MRTTSLDRPDPDSELENRRIFDEWQASEQAKRDELVAAACRYVSCDGVQHGLARVSTVPDVVVAVGTPDQIRELLAEHESHGASIEA